MCAILVLQITFVSSFVCFVWCVVHIDAHVRICRLCLCVHRHIYVSILNIACVCTICVCRGIITCLPLCVGVGSAVLVSRTQTAFVWVHETSSILVC